MTVPAQATLFNESTANGLTTSFPYEFMIASANDITVELDGVVTTTGFTVTGVGNSNGGSIDFSVAPANGVTVLRYLDSELSRTEEDYQQFGDFNADTIDLEFDRLWLAMQSIALKLGLCVRAPISSASGVLPEPAANNVIGWNEDGTGFKNFSPVDNTLLAAELATSDGASKIGFLQSGTGAVPTDVERKLQELIVTPQDFGDLGSGSADAAACLTKAVTEAISSGRKLVGTGTFRIDTPVDFRFADVDFSSATINVNHESGPGIIIGGNASLGSNPPQRFGAVTRISGSDSQSNPTVRAIGVKGQNISLERTTYFQVYADTHNVGETALRNLDYSSAYSNFHLKYATTIELTSNQSNAGGANDSNPGGNVQWINENQFYLNRTTNILINGTYEHNHNKFYNGTLEGVASIVIDRGRDNKLIGMRFEAGPTTITFGASTSGNLVLNTWDEGSSELGLPVKVGSIVNDSGVSNIVIDDMAFHYTSELVAAADVSDVVLNSAIGAVFARAPELQRVAGLSGNPILVSELLPVQKNAIFTFVARFSDVGDDVKYRCALKFFDKNLKPINASASWIASPVMTTVSSNEITQGAGSDLNWEVLDPAEYAVIMQAAVAAGAVFVQAIIKASNSQLSSAKARRLEITYSTPGNAEQRMGGKPKHNTTYVVSAAPTKGFAPIGFSAVKSDGTAIYICSFALDTSSAAASVSGATSISVASATGVTVGDIVGINLDNRDTHWTTVSSVAGTTIGLTAGLAGDAAAGARVVFNRWATK